MSHKTQWFVYIIFSLGPTMVDAGSPNFKSEITADKLTTHRWFAGQTDSSSYFWATISQFPACKLRPILLDDILSLEIYPGS